MIDAVVQNGTMRFNENIKIDNPIPITRTTNALDNSTNLTGFAFF